MKATVTRIMYVITILALLQTIAALPAFAGKIRTIDDNDTVVVRGNVHPLARPEFEAGATDPSLPMERMILTLRLDRDRQAALDRLVAEQLDAVSSNYHRWLTPEEFGERFGPGPEEIAVLTGWLSSHGFAVEEVGKGRTWINFSGRVADVESAFHTKIRDYRVDGKLRHANAQDPAIPRALADLVAGVVSLHNFPRRAMNSGIRPTAPRESLPADTYGSSHYLAPGDFSTIYNVNALYSAGIDGTGQSIAIVGRTHPSSSNWSTFRSEMGLAANPPQVIVNGPDPGDLGADEDGEADLDVEWSGAVARNATIRFVVSQSTSSTDGVDLSAQYIVDNNIAPVMSTSFGMCESDMGSSGNAFYNSLWAQAAAQGITSFVSSADAGAAGCNAGSDAAGSGRAVSGMASTPYNVAVGGTQFNEDSGSYWNSADGTGYVSAKGYIPEVAWNESGAAGSCPSGDTCADLWATGGGVSSVYAKPAWQAAPGVPADGKRDIPDVSLSAAGHDGYLVQTQGALWIMGGTSAASPSFAGLMALVVQKTGQRQGNANTRFYQLGTVQYGSGGAAVFHDITAGSNTVPGVTGYSCTTGYDSSTGLGSVDAAALINNWVPPDLTITSAHAGNFIQGETGAQYTLTVANSGFGPTEAPVSVTDILPAGLTATALGGTGWTCSVETLTCTRSDVLAPGARYPAITLTANVANAPASVTNIAMVAGGGELNAANDAATDVTIVNELQYSLDISFTGSGGGSIYNTATTLTCGSSCSSPIDAGTSVTLHPAVDQYSLFTGWSGVCTNASGDCSFVMNGVTGATAAFAIDTAHSVLIDVPSAVYYPSIAAAFLAASDNAVIKTWGVTFTGDLVFAQGTNVTLKGGYNGGYTNNNGVTTQQGSLTITNGALTVENVAVW